MFITVCCVFTAVCVAGFSPSKNEILELHLPLKLFANENKVMTKEFCTWAFILYPGDSNVTQSLCRVFLCVCVDAFRVSVQNGTSKSSMAVSQTVPCAASDTSQERGEFLARAHEADNSAGLPEANWFYYCLRSKV